MYKSILLKDKCVKRYSFQRLSIILAIVLWIFTAVRVFSPGIVRAVSVNSRKDILQQCVQGCFIRAYCLWGDN